MIVCDDHYRMASDNRFVLLSHKYVMNRVFGVQCYGLAVDSYRCLRYDRLVVTIIFGFN